MKLNWLALACVAGALAACSGGSSKNDPDPIVIAPIEPGPLMTITADNAEAMSAETLHAFEDALSASDGALDLGGAVGARIEGDAPAAAMLAVRMAETARDAVVSTSYGGAVGAVITRSEDCDGGGSMEVSINTGTLSQIEFTNQLQDGNIPAGTSVSFTLANCIQEPGMPALNGGMTIVFEQFAVDGEVGLDPMVLQFSAVFQGLQGPEGTIDGDIEFLLTSGVGTADIDVRGDALQFSAAQGTLALLDFLMNAEEDTERLTQSFNFRLSISGVGDVTAATLAPWVMMLDADYPISGVLQILGANDTGMIVTALDEVNVQIEVDTDGDGIADVTILTTWAELEEA